jgi:hypothetical protein
MSILPICQRAKLTSDQILEKRIEEIGLGPNSSLWHRQRQRRQLIERLTQMMTPRAQRLREVEYHKGDEAAYENAYVVMAFVLSVNTT